ncbi:low molecular weight protein arginine phosphatase [Candidatus Latescibacterota bacterium]
MVFVCTGNICRSPMAAGIMKECILDEVTLKGQNLPIKVISAGTHAINGYPASEHAIEVLAQHGIDIRFHRSRQLTEEIVKDADLILTMEKYHTNIIRQNWPQIYCVYELKKFGHTKEKNKTDMEIMDPIGMSFDVYMNIFNEIKKEISRVSQTIFSLARENFTG